MTSQEMVLLDEKLEDILAGLQINPQKSLRQLSQETDVSASSASKATKLITFRPQRFRCAHELNTVDVPHSFCFVIRF
jgi:hypothetical protein